LTFGFDNLTYQEESKFKNFKILKDKLETLKKMSIHNTNGLVIDFDKPDNFVI